jgi:DNA-binding NtrC family response regulator
MPEAILKPGEPPTLPEDGKGRVLVIDDEADIRESLETLLVLEGYAVDLAQNAAEGLRALDSRAYDLVLLDLMMPDRSGMDVLREVRERDHETPIFLITAYGSVEAAVEALKSGANDYFSKPWDNEKLLIEIDRMIAGNRLERENRQLKRALKQRYSNSPRADHMFVAVNSGSLPPDLLESSLFGHSKGAFTSAVQSHKGYFEIANRGTIFFDEIGTIGPETQAKLLRVIQEREFMPLGSTDTIKVDVRILAATNADLKKLVDERRFREDLYYRLNVINIALPPLRDRKEDVPPLVEHFFTKYCRENDKFLDADRQSTLRFQPEAMQILMDHNWPGNVRELENVVERAVVLAAEESVPVEVLPEHLLLAGGIRIHKGDGGPLPPDASLNDIMADFERRTIIERLEQNGWSQTEAAESLHVPLSTLNQKIKRLSIDARRKSQ